MDPLSVTASVVAVLQLANAVLLGCYRIRAQIKDAEKEISQIIDEIEDLATILSDLQDVSLSDSPSTGSLGDKSGPLASIKTVLDELSQKMAHLSKPSMKSKLYWPFESKAIQRILDVIQKQKSTLLLALSSRQTKMMALHSEKINSVHDSVIEVGDRLQSAMTAVGTQVVDSVQEHVDRAKRDAVLKWYKSCDPEQNHKLSRDKHDPDTAKWIFGVEEFQRWAVNEGESLWLHGIPGAGKTILCSTIIDHVQNTFEKNSNIRVIYFYFDFGDNSKQSFESFLKSNIFQLASAADAISESAIELYERYSGLQQPNSDELLRVFMDELAKAERTFLLIDALDECPEDERQQLFKSLFRSPLPEYLSILITSRKEPDIEVALKDTISHTICIQSSVIDADVRTHVSNVISRDPALRRWKPAISKEVMDALVAGSNGMFRWAVCQLDTLRKCLTPAMIRAELKMMPETLDQMYDRILQAVPRLHQHYVQSALHLLAFSARPILVAELAEAVVINPKEERFDPDESRLMDENLILDLCGTLITTQTYEYSPYSQDWLHEKSTTEHTYLHQVHVVSLSHYTVKEYIMSQRLQESALSRFYASERVANQFLAEICLLYLLEFNAGEISVPLGYSDFPFLQYSGRFWIDHWKLADRDAEQSLLQKLLYRLFDPSNLNGYVNWLNVWSPDLDAPGRNQYYRYQRDIKRTAELHPQPIYFAAFLGDLPLLRSLVTKGCDIFATEGYFGSAFAAAAFQGHEAVVKYFLDNGADPNLQGHKLGSVLQTAAAGGSLDVVQLLVDAGANVNAQGGEYNTALIAAASKEHEAVVTLLIKNGADLSIGSRYHGSSLYQAAANGDTRMVITLLGAGADVNYIGDSDGTALYAAALSGSVSLVQLLLRRGADVNKGGDGECGYALVAAAKGGHCQIVRNLLAAGADVNLSGEHREFSALMAAIESRDMPTFRAVVDGGADLNETGRYMNPFHAAIWTGELAMAKILLERGAQFEDNSFLESVKRFGEDPYFMKKMLTMKPNVDAHAGARGSALHLAVSNGLEEAVWLLLEHNPYLQALAEDGPILSFAIEAKMFRVAKELIGRGVEVNWEGRGWSPLGVACRQGNFEMATFLLQKGADVDGNGGDAIYLASYKENEEMVRFLVEHGADVNLMLRSCECTPLQDAAENGKESMMKLLLDLGAKINGIPGKRGSIIHYAMRSQKTSIVRFLLDNGANVDDTNEGESTLCKALWFDMEDLLPLLVEKGADVNRKEAGMSALGHAYCKNDKTHVEILLTYGASFTKAGTDVLLDAIRKKPVDDVSTLLELGMNPNYRAGYETPLGVATKKSKKDVIELLLKYGGDLNMNVDTDRGALAIACDSGDLVMARFLLSRGADPNLIKKGYRYPLYDAARLANIPLIDLLLEHGADISIDNGHVFKAATYGGEKAITRLLSSEMPAAEREKYLDRSLQMAAYNANLNLCTWLLGQGANLNYIGGEYGSPLQASVSNDQLSSASEVNNRRLIIEMFLSRGANVNYAAPSEEFPSALQLAIGRAPKSAMVFIDAGAEINVCGGMLHSPLQTAARYNPSLLVHLLALGANVNVVGGTYGSPLHAAAYAHNVDSIKILIEHGADVNLVEGKYGSVIQAAAKENSVSSGTFTAEWESVQTMKVLNEYGASVTSQGGKYCTALQMAAKSGNLAAVKWLVAHGADPYVEGGKYGTALKAAVKKEKYAIISYLKQHFPQCT